MISCYIFSETQTVHLLDQHISRFPLTTLIGHSTLLSKDLSTIIKLKPKIVFVDASLLGTCKTTLVRIAQLCTVIYVSDTSEHAMLAFEALGFDYLLKSHSFERFEMSINKFVQFSLRAPEGNRQQAVSITHFFFIKADAKGLKEVRIRYCDVLYIEAEQNYVRIHLVDGRNYTSHNTMKEMEESLPEELFGRVHKSFIINYEKISSIEGNDVYLSESGKPKIHVGNTYRKAFNDKKNQNIIKRKTFLQVMDLSRNASLIAIMISCFEGVFSFEAIAGYLS